MFTKHSNSLSKAHTTEVIRILHYFNITLLKKQIFVDPLMLCLFCTKLSSSFGNDFSNYMQDNFHVIVWTYIISYCSKTCSMLDSCFANILIAVDAMVGNRIWFGGLFTSSGRRRQINAEKTFELSPVQVKLYQDQHTPSHIIFLFSIMEIVTLHF